MWWTYAALVVFVALLSGTWMGYQSYNTYMSPYYTLMSMQVDLGGNGTGVDLTSASSESFMDAGMVKFAPGTELLKGYSWHFKYQTTYCVAPLAVPGGAVPRRSYDIWVVGKGCCSISSSDYRCGLWNSPDLSTSLAVRVTNDGDLKYYFLAAQQAASVFKFKVRSPVFFYHTANVVDAITGRKTKSGSGSKNSFGSGFNNGVNGVGLDKTSTMSGAGFGGQMEGMKQEAYNNFCVWVVIVLIFSLFGASMATVRFSFFGRGKWGTWGTEEALVHGAATQHMMNYQSHMA